jgi:hypothetical protein
MTASQSSKLLSQHRLLWSNIAGQEAGKLHSWGRRSTGGRGNLKTLSRLLCRAADFLELAGAGVSCASAVKRVRLQSVSLLLVLMPVAVAVAVAQPKGADVSGIVRDAQGIPQMGALVQALLPDATPVGMAVTDLKGHYVIRNLTPGKYQVRASAALFLPSMRGDLRLRAGAPAHGKQTQTTK